MNLDLRTIYFYVGKRKVSVIVLTPTYSIKRSILTFKALKTDSAPDSKNNLEASHFTVWKPTLSDINRIGETTIEGTVSELFIQSKTSASPHDRKQSREQICHVA